MNLHDARRSLAERGGDPAGLAAFGPHYETSDGATVIPVAKPVGVFVVKDGKPIWAPATDDTRIALMGILVGLVAATLAGVTLIRRPPWPDLHGEVSPQLG